MLLGFRGTRLLAYIYAPSFYDASNISDVMQYTSNPRAGGIEWYRDTKSTKTAASDGIMTPKSTKTAYWSTMMVSIQANPTLTLGSRVSEQIWTRSPHIKLHTPHWNEYLCT